ncbi:Polymer-forming cytoskeletal [Pragia fontium]|nr:Polymer-forming cytoskeletal [Pragia fontium]
MDSVKKQKQFFKGVSFCIILILWGSALVLYITGHLLLSVISSTLSLLFFLYLTNLRTKFSFMFKKKISNVSANVIPPVAITSASDNELNAPSDGVDLRQRCTIIARNAVFSGNIEDNGDIRIYGKVIGNINITEGAIRVMSTGYVKGELNAPEIIIDGEVSGRCFAENIDILEHGTLRGITCCRNFSIKRGGVFIGQSEEWTPKAISEVDEAEYQQIESNNTRPDAQLYIVPDEDALEAEEQPA